MRNWQLLVLSLVLMMFNFCAQANVLHVYKYQMSQFDSLNDASLVSEFLAVDNFLKKSFKSVTGESELSSNLKSVVVHSYPIIHTLKDQKVVPCDSMFGLCIRTEVLIDLNEDSFKKYLNAMVPLALKHSERLEGMLRAEMELGESNQAPLGSTLIQSVSAVSSEFINLQATPNNLKTQKLTIPLYAGGQLADPSVVSRSQARAVAIIKAIRDMVEGATFNTLAEQRGPYINLDVNFKMDTEYFTESLIFKNILGELDLSSLNGNKICGPQFSDTFLTMKGPINRLRQRVGSPLLTDADFYKNKSEFGIDFYKFKGGVSLVRRDSDNTSLLGLCDNQYYSNVKSTRWHDQDPWLKGNKLHCNSRFNCELLGALWLLNESSVDIFVNDIKVCELLKFSDLTLKPFGTVTNEVRMPSIKLFKSNCRYFAEGNIPDSVVTLIKYNIPNLNSFSQ